MTRRTRYLGYGAGSMVVLYLAYGFILRPLSEEPKKYRNQLNTEQQRLKSHNTVLKEQAAIEAAWEAHKAKIGGKDQNEVSRAFAQEMSKLYEKAGVDPGRSGEQHGEKLDAFHELSYTVNFRCDQTRYAQLLRALDAFSGYLRVNSMTVTSHFDEAKGDMDVILKVSTIWFGGEPAGRGGRS